MRAQSMRQRGASLVVVLIMLTVIFVIGLISSRLALFSERSARNDRDRQVAFQGAEAALLDAELDIFGPNSAVNRRVCLFDSKKVIEFYEGCGTGTNAGMCIFTVSPGDAWKEVKANYLSETGTTVGNKTVEYGQFTGQTLPQSTSGLTTKLPRYTIEAVPYAGTGAANDLVGGKNEQAFMVTAMGFGFRTETQVLLQALIYKPANKPGSGC